MVSRVHSSVVVVQCVSIGTGYVTEVARFELLHRNTAIVPQHYYCPLIVYFIDCCHVVGATRAHGYRPGDGPGG